ncbi:hypothetical protein FIU09_15895 [Stenotrophomonas maltophilia]|nr:hypothetical protein FIU09_15895 [Stenotrophomonas maltophilia]
MTPDPRDRGFRSIQVEHAGSAECILRRSMRGYSAGLRPAPAVVPAAGRQPQKQQPKQQQKPAIRGMAGWVRLRGTP